MSGERGGVIVQAFKLLNFNRLKDELQLPIKGHRSED